MGDLLPLLFVISLIVVPIGVVAARLIRPMGVETEDVARNKQWACRFSLLMLVIPALVAGLFVTRIVLEMGPPPRSFWRLAGKLWIPTSIAGLLSGVVASHFARWSGDELYLIVIHAFSIFFIATVCYASSFSLENTFLGPDQSRASLKNFARIHSQHSAAADAS